MKNINPTFDFIPNLSPVRLKEIIREQAQDESKTVVTNEGSVAKQEKVNSCPKRWKVDIIS